MAESKHFNYASTIQQILIHCNVFFFYMHIHPCFIQSTNLILNGRVHSINSFNLSICWAFSTKWQRLTFNLLSQRRSLSEPKINENIVRVFTTISLVSVYHLLIVIIQFICRNSLVNLFTWPLVPAMPNNGMYSGLGYSSS